MALIFGFWRLNLDIAYTNREHQRYLVNQMDELSARQLDEKEKAMREHEADLAKEAAYQQRIKDALKFYWFLFLYENLYFWYFIQYNKTYS